MSNLIHTITKWVVSSNGLGGYSFSAPVSVQARWENKQELFRTPNGDEFMSKAVVFLASDVNLGDILYLGVSAAADPSVLDGTSEVKQFFKSPSVSGNQYTRKAVL